jgi:hypothetical protein
MLKCVNKSVSRYYWQESDDWDRKNLCGIHLKIATGPYRWKFSRKPIMSLGWLEADPQLGR